MNERIQELAEQAGFYVAMFDPGNKDNATIEKFAELIIRECAWAAQNKDDTMDLRYARAVAAGKIKEHFGVK